MGQDPAVIRLDSGRLQHLVDALQLAHSCSTPYGMVVDLGGKVFKGALQGCQPRSVTVTSRGTVIRNGTLKLPPGSQLVVKAQGCRLQDVHIRGDGVAGPDLGMGAGCWGYFVCERELCPL